MSHSQTAGIADYAPTNDPAVLRLLAWRDALRANDALLRLLRDGVSADDDEQLAYWANQHLDTSLALERVGKRLRQMHAVGRLEIQPKGWAW